MRIEKDKRGEKKAACSRACHVMSKMYSASLAQANTTLDCHSGCACA